MKLAYNLLFFLTLAAHSALWAAKPDPEILRLDFSKTIKKEFEVGNNPTVHINNKYGKVDVKTWDRSRVKVEVRILVRAASEADAQKVFDRIGINFSNPGNYVKAETSIEPMTKKWWETATNKSDFSINYEVYVPGNANLELYNKYGDVYAAAINGKGVIDVKYGNFKLDGLKEASNITLAYGNGKLTKAGKLVTDVSYGRLNVGECSEMDVNSKYSTLTLDNVNALRSTSKYDTYKLGNVELFRNSGKYDNIEVQEARELVIVSKYTNLRAEQIHNVVDMNLEYSGVVVSQLNKGFKDVNLTGKYTDFKFTVQNGAVFRMDAYSDYAGIKYPSGMVVTFDKKQNNSHELKGHVGQEGAAVIRARLSYGGLKVQ